MRPLSHCILFSILFLAAAQVEKKLTKGKSEDTDGPKIFPKEILDFLDKNGDGMISRQEMIDNYQEYADQYNGGVQPKELFEKVFDKHDTNSDGLLTYEEFIASG
ncbi:hypothetical protein PENTCL1PPCAC_983 [Pristionchus entomophagus]|uniref:EF-hand domain-containing protein n=1 Tax=Pristionchus entomophagus TaxID=358040 RepID=A0AAV5SDQ4_9BILA|nr:hypothetical protein PENTCL1PPCAC_983 [Pristionchus entomophagus]